MRDWIAIVFLEYNQMPYPTSVVTITRNKQRGSSQVVTSAFPLLNASQHAIPEQTAPFTANPSSQNPPMEISS
jgi:hypothetical protein